MAKASATITVYKQIDIESVTWYYKLQASTASPPAKPTTETPSGWSTTEPSYTEGSTNSLYICQKTTFSDGSFEYSDVSLSSAYEASKAAYNKSVQAKETAEAAQESIDGLEVGGRNILLNSATNYPSAYSSATLTVEKNVAVPEFNCTDGIRCYGKGGTNEICMRINKNTHGLSTATDISVAQQRYVFSIYIKNNHETNVFYVAANLPGTGKTAIQPSEAKRLVFYCTGNGTNIIQFNLSTNEIGDDYDITFWHPQIELGNKVTDWSPAVEDMDVSVGSRNLILDTATQRVSPASASQSAYALPHPMITDYGDTVLNNTNDYFTYSFDYEVTGNTASDAFIYVQIRGSGVNSGSKGYASYVKDAPVGKHACTFRLTSAQATVGGSRTAAIRLRNGSDGAVLTVKNVKLEKGNRATDWSPAPEDVENGITSAQATADAALLQSVEYIIGTQTGVTGSWTGKSTGMSALRDGAQIRYWLPHAGSGNATLNLTLSNGTTTGAIPVYRQGGSVNSSNAVVANRVTTHFPPGSVVPMTYGVNRPISVVSNGTSYTGLFTGWFVDGAYDSGNTYNRVRMQNVITASTAITAGRIICGTASGYKNIGANIEFDLSYPILYAVSAIAAAGTGDNNYLSLNGVSATSNGTIESGTAKKTLYLKGTVTGNTFKISASPFMTTATPSSSNGFYYIPLGIMYSTTAIYFQSSNRLYAYLDGAFQPVDTAAVLRAQAAKEIAEATGQYFWQDDSGVHIASEPEAPTATRNMLLNSLGMLFRRGANNLLALLTGTNPSVNIYDGSGNAESNVLAQFAASGVRIGKNGQTNVQIAPDNVVMTAPDGNTGMRVSYTSVDDDSGDLAYGIAIDDGDIYSGISLIPAKDDGEFNGRREYVARMDRYTWQSKNGQLWLTDDGLEMRSNDSEALPMTMGFDGVVEVSGGYGGLVAVETDTVSISYAAGTIGTRGAIALVGTTIKSGYTYIGASIVDQRNTVPFMAVISENMTTSNVHVCAYRGTDNAVSNAEVTVRRVWLKTGTTA